MYICHQGESAEQAMRREANEEAGATLTRLTPVAQYIITTTPDSDSARASTTSTHVKTVYAVLALMQHSSSHRCIHTHTDTHVHTHTIQVHTT
jgi:8-oxo-dGTP pyrophosphatase MutT (NUDIX family)